MATAEQHYDQRYFDWQKRIGQFGGEVNAFLFQDAIQPEDNVLDFGCGGGYLLKHLVCGQRIGIDVNDSAREAAKANGVKAVAAVADVEDGWADVLISNNALEHVTNPFEILQRLKPKVKKGGKIIFVLPHEKRNPYRAGDMNRHLFTWSPMCAGNLFSAAGFQVKKVETIDHIWPPVGYYQIRRYFGLTAFRCVSWLYTRLLSSWTLVRVEASNE